jgi:hypothetical protein
MQLHLTPEQESQLAEIARHQGITADALLTDIALGLLEENEQEREIIRERVRQANQGVFIEEEEMDARVQAMLQPR